MISRRWRQCASRPRGTTTRSHRRRRTRCTCPRTSTRSSACGRIRYILMSPLGRPPRTTGRRIRRRRPPALPHLFDFMVTADLQMAKDGEAKQLVDAPTGLSNFPYTSLAIDTALAAIPARYALDRGEWWEAAHLPVRDSQFPAAQSITYCARALGAARAGDLTAARAEIGHLDEIEAKLIAAKDEYWAGQTRIQKEAAAGWLTFAEGKREAAIAAMKVAAERDDASEKNVAMENKVVPIRALLGELYLAAQMPKEALAEFEASQKTMPNRFRTIADTATAARAVGSVEAAKRYYRALAGLAVNGDGQRPELAEAKTYLAQN